MKTLSDNQVPVNLPLRYPLSETVGGCIHSKLENKLRKKKTQLYSNKPGGKKERGRHRIKDSKSNRRVWELPE